MGLPCSAPPIATAGTSEWRFYTTELSAESTGQPRGGTARAPGSHAEGDDKGAAPTPSSVPAAGSVDGEESSKKQERTALLTACWEAVKEKSWRVSADRRADASPGWSNNSTTVYARGHSRWSLSTCRTITAKASSPTRFWLARNRTMRISSDTDSSSPHSSSNEVAQR